MNKLEVLDAQRRGKIDTLKPGVVVADYRPGPEGNVTYYVIGQVYELEVEAFLIYITETQGIWVGEMSDIIRPPDTDNFQILDPQTLMTLGMIEELKDEENGFQKFDQEKYRPDLMPADAFREICKVLTYGARKYDADNWRKVTSWRRYFSAAQRHLWEWYEGEDNDRETGLSHLAHAACCIIFLLALSLRRDRSADDRPEPEVRKRSEPEDI